MKLSDLKSSNYLFVIALMLLSVISVNQWLKVEIGNTAISYAIYIYFFGTIVYFICQHKIKIFEPQYLSVVSFLIIAALGVVKGYFVAENYWEYKNLFFNACILMMPLLVYVLGSPDMLKQSVRWWFYIGLLGFATIFYWQVNFSQFYLGPLYFIACFVPFIRNRFIQAFILVLLVALTMYNYQDNRSQFIKGIITFGTIAGLYVAKWIPNFLLKIVHLALIIAPIVLLYYGLSGQFNIFEEFKESNEGKNTIVIYDEELGDFVELDMADDTRTTIYNEVVYSALINDYVVFGRTPARGNDTFAYRDASEDMQHQHYDETVKFERSMNELCFPNIFTWLGVVGMVLYALIYIVASFLALYYSNNRYIKIFGCVVAAYFAYGWVENATNIDILNVTYWMFISICMSPVFRRMNNAEFKNWAANILKRR